jgi:regulatory protein
MPTPQLSLKARACAFFRVSTAGWSWPQAGPPCRGGRRCRSPARFAGKNNWLSQERFSESLIHRRAARYGNSRIVAELQSHGVNGEALQELKSTWLTPNWNAREIWQRKFGTVTAPERQ